MTTKINLFYHFVKYKKNATLPRLVRLSLTQFDAEQERTALIKIYQNTTAEIKKLPYQRDILSGLMACGLTLLFLGEFIHYESNAVYLGSYVISLLMTAAGLVRYWLIIREERKLLLPLVLIFLIGLLHFHSGHYNYYKDIWYFSKPIFYITAGMIVCNSGLRKSTFLGMVVYIALALSLVHIYTFLLEPQLLAESVNDIRKTAGGGNLLIVFAAAFISSRQRFGQVSNFLRIPREFFLLILYASLVLSFSRTIFGVYLITMFFLERLYDLKYAARKIGFAAAAACCLLAIVLLLPSSFIEDTKVGEFKDKLLNSFNEITIHHRYDTGRQIALNWRGYEASLALEEIGEGDILDKTMGYGFGKTIFIGFDDYLGHNLFDIPTLHNGFLQVIIKTGCVGLLLYIGFFISGIRVIRKYRQADNDTADFLAGVLASSFFATLVITGYYNKSALDSTCIITGFLFSWIRKSGRNENIQQRKTHVMSEYTQNCKPAIGTMPYREREESGISIKDFAAR